MQAFTGSRLQFSLSLHWQFRATRTGGPTSSAATRCCSRAAPARAKIPHGATGHRGASGRTWPLPWAPAAGPPRPRRSPRPAAALQLPRRYRGHRLACDIKDAASLLSAVPSRLRDGPRNLVEAGGSGSPCGCVPVGRAGVTGTGAGTGKKGAAAGAAPHAAAASEATMDRGRLGAAAPCPRLPRGKALPAEPI